MKHIKLSQGRGCVSSSENETNRFELQQLAVQGVLFSTSVMV